MAAAIQDLRGEIWKPVVGYEGLYEVSNHGRVRGLDRLVNGPWGKRLWRGQLILPIAVANGGGQSRLQVVLYRNRKGAVRRIHRLVADAFIGQCPPRCEVCHNDGNATNNHVSNLRYDTRSSNIRDAINAGTHNTVRLTPALVRALRAQSRLGLSHSELAQQYNLPRDTVYSAVTGRTWSHLT